MPGVGLHLWKSLVCRNLLFILLLSYIAFSTMLFLRLLEVNNGQTSMMTRLDISQNPSAPIWSPGGALDVEMQSAKHLRHANYIANDDSNKSNNGSRLSSHEYRSDDSKSMHGDQNDGQLNVTDILLKHNSNASRNNADDRWPQFNVNSFMKPSPLVAPHTVKNNFGDFYFMHEDVFVYSAFFDDRKKEEGLIYIRIMTLSSQVSSKRSIFCHFPGDIVNVTRKGERYELCENHNRKFGGYVFSCLVPEFLGLSVSDHVIVSWGQTGHKVLVPLLTIRPSAHKIPFLDSYVGETNGGSSFPLSSLDINYRNTIPDTIPDIIPDTTTKPKLSFAICVPPLFGHISPHRLIEFIELSLILGVDHIFFYKHSIPNDVFNVISYYRDFVTLLPWQLPRSVTPGKIWYSGQLLAHNDCLYRAMPRFDLIAFNDIDEFVVPHQNGSRTWGDIFPEMLSNRTCGWSLVSAFFDPGIRNLDDPEALTPELFARSSKFSQVRTKVMVCPWRVFEVGIHHVSKQNRERWAVHEVNPSHAFLHHYRRCVANYGMDCRDFVRDTIIEDQYGDTLRARYKTALSIIKI